MTNHFRLYFILLCTLTFSGIFNASYATKSHPNKSVTAPLDSIAAVVNTNVITHTELKNQIELVKKQSGNQVTLPTESVLEKQVLDQLITRKLQLELAKQSGIKVNDTLVDKAIHGIADGNKISVAELYEKTAQQGLPKSDYRKLIREEIAIQQIEHQQLGNKISVSKQEVDDFMRSAAWKAFNTKEYHLLDILIALPEVPNPQDIIEAKKHAENVLDKVNHGISFQEAAMSESASTQALQGGDLGWRKLPEIPPNFADQIVHLKENGIMGPILTNNGFHIVKLAGLRNTVPKDIESQHKQIEQLIYQRKFEEALQNWTTKLKSEAFININPQV